MTTISTDNWNEAYAVADDILRALGPLNRNIVSDEFEQGLEYLRRFVGLNVCRYAAGSECWTWLVPPKWRVRDGWIRRGDEVLASFRAHPLQVMSYSTPVRGTFKGSELLEHIHVHRSLPEAIPFEFSYYAPRWGFCLTHAQKARLRPDETYEVLIDSERVNDPLSVGEHTVPGTSGEYVYFLAHLDHPCQANDGLVGVAANVALATRLRGRPLYYNYVFLFVPETIGSIAYLSDHEDRIERTRCSVFTEMVGLDHPLVLQQSRKPGALINAYAAEAIRRRQGECRAYEYLTVAANDEKVFDGPCVGIPSISISRVDHEAHLRAMERARADGRREHLPPYPEYHSDRDNAALVSPGRVHETIQVLADLVELLEADFIPRPKFRGPAFLSRYDLWVDWRTNPQLHDKVISLMYALDEGMTAFQLARRFDLPMADVAGLLERFHQKGLIEKERIATAKDRG